MPLCRNRSRRNRDAPIGGKTTCGFFYLTPLRDPDSWSASSPRKLRLCGPPSTVCGEKTQKKLIVILKTKELVTLILILKDLLQLILKTKDLLMAKERFTEESVSESAPYAAHLLRQFAN